MSTPQEANPQKKVILLGKKLRGPISLQFLKHQDHTLHSCYFQTAALLLI